MELKYITDKKRHLICVPYSIENLHLMAEQLDIKRCWFHKNHYDIPKQRINEIEKKCQIISQKEIVEIIKSPEYAEIIISESVSVFGASPKDYFWQTQIKYNGNN
jgi:hypothetical protein